MTRFVLIAVALISTFLPSRCVLSQHVHLSHPSTLHSHGEGKKIWRRFQIYNVGGQEPVVTWKLMKKV